MNKFDTTKICLILTAAIEVKNKQIVRRNDTRTRLNDYKWALKNWLTKQKLLAKIIFVENSGYSLSELKEVVRNNNPYHKEVEFIQYVAQGKETVDKSYGELFLIYNAVKKSRLMRDCEYFVEASGRAFWANGDAIIKNLPENFDVASKFSHNLAYADTEVMAMKKSFFTDVIFPYAESHLDESIRCYLERAYAKAIHLAISKDYRWYPFAVEPIIVGIGGTKNKRYTHGYWHSIFGTIISFLYYNFYKTSYGKNQKHLLEKWSLASEPERGIK